MAHCMDTLLEEKKKTKSNEQPKIYEFRKVYYRKLFHYTDDVDDEDVFHNDLHKSSKTGGDWFKSQRQEGSSNQESRSDDDTNARYIPKVMDLVTGTPAIVRLRQDYCRIQDYMFSNYKVKFIYTGSKAEGLDLPGSDEDYMREFTNIKVVSDTQAESHPDANFLIVPSQNNSCFVFLKLVGRSLFNKQFLMMSQRIENDILLSSLLFKLSSSNTKSFIYQLSMQGPSRELSAGGYSCDNVRCFKCSSWPVTCDEWIRRERQHNWPDDSLKRKIIQCGFHLVSIGHPLSPQKEMEWRVSFSIAERELVWSFNHVQMHCYAFLKIVLKECLKPRFLQLSKEEMPLCSYFLKTLLFWSIEETKPSFWKSENLTECFRYLLRTLHKHVISGHLSHYFMPDFNLFEIKVKGHAQQMLIKILHSVLDLDIEGAMGTSETLRKASINLTQSNITMQRNNDTFEYVKKISCYITLIIYQLLPLLKEDITVMIRRLSRTDLNSELKKAAWKWMLSYLYYTDAFGTRCSTNKSLYKILRICNMKDIEFDLASTKLLHATRLLLQRDFHTCLTIISHMFSSIPPYAVYLGMDKMKNKPEVVELFKNVLCKNDLNMFHFLSQEIVFDVVFSTHNIDLFPAAIQVELKYGNIFGIIFISPYVYSYYLMFLCYHGLNDPKSRDRALRMLLGAVGDEERVGNIKHHSFNIAGHCLYLRGLYDEARVLFTTSANTTSNILYENGNSCHYYLRLLDR